MQLTHAQLTHAFKDAVRTELRKQVLALQDTLDGKSRKLFPVLFHPPFIYFFKNERKVERKTIEANLMFIGAALVGRVAAVNRENAELREENKVCW